MSRREQVWRWTPAALLLLGATITVGIDSQRAMPLRSALDSAIPVRFEQLESRDVVVSDAELRVAGVSDYLMREYFARDSGASADSVAASAEAATAPAAVFSVYVGYYDSQTQGRTIHSPKNCLPGSGWEAIRSREVTLQTALGAVPANRYLLQRDEQKALVVYWYQGRGRVEANEYLVKAQLLRDAALHGRTEEALVRIVVPIVTTEEEAFERAAAAAAQLVPSVDRALPAA